MYNNELVSKLEDAGYKFFMVYVEWKTVEDATLPVIATSSDEAEEIAVAMIDEETGGVYDEIDCWTSSEEGGGLIGAPEKEIERVLKFIDAGY